MLKQYAGKQGALGQYAASANIHGLERSPGLYHGEASGKHFQLAVYRIKVFACWLRKGFRQHLYKLGTRGFVFVEALDREHNEFLEVPQLPSDVTEHGLLPGCQLTRCGYPFSNKVSPNSRSTSAATAAKCWKLPTPSVPGHGMQLLHKPWPCSFLALG